MKSGRESVRLMAVYGTSLRLLAATAVTFGVHTKPRVDEGVNRVPWRRPRSPAAPLAVHRPRPRTAAP